MLDYKAIEIFTSEQARSADTPVVDAVLNYVRGLKIAARCIVTRGIAGCYESGEMATGRLEILAYNLPVRICIILPAGESDRVLAGLDHLVEDGIIALQDLPVMTHRVSNAFFPRQLKVRDVMTPEPKSVFAGSPLSDAAKLLLSSIFTGLPVVDELSRPVGVITQGDLITRGGLPIRLGLLADADQARLETILTALSKRTAAEVMTSPAMTIAADRPLAEAVDLMLARGVKRLPVVDGSGRLAGILSRLDIFRTVMHTAPDWHAFRAQKIDVRRLKSVAAILRRDTHTVSPDTPLAEVIRVIDRNDIQRVAVVDSQNKLLGMISDGDLLRFFQPEQAGIWRLLAKVKQAFTPETSPGALDARLAATTAAAIMITDLITVRDDTLIEEAVRLMTEKALKRLPVIDACGHFKGMISRDALLRTGFGHAA